MFLLLLLLLHAFVGIALIKQVQSFPVHCSFNATTHKPCKYLPAYPSQNLSFSLDIVIYLVLKLLSMVCLY